MMTVIRPGPISSPARRTCTITLVVALTIGTLALPRSTRSNDDLTHQGKPLSAWIGQLRDGKPALQIEAIQALLAIGPAGPGVVEALGEVLQDKDEIVRLEAVRALRKMGWRASPVDAAIARLMTDEDERVRREAIATNTWLRQPSPFEARVKGARKRVGIGGCTKAGEDAVQEGLIWLARHQRPDGSWAADRTKSEIDSCTCAAPGWKSNDVGVTALALLAFLGSGVLPDSKEECTDACLKRRVRLGESVDRALKWLIKTQGPDGGFSPEGPKLMYNHLIATLAMCEAHGLTGSPATRESAQLGLTWLRDSQNPYRGWRYSKRSGDNDTSVTGWAISALHAGRAAGLDSGEGSLKGAIAFVESVTTPYFGVGYTKAEATHVVTKENEGYAPHPTLIAAGVLGRIYAGHPLTAPAVNSALAKVQEDPPRWRPEARSIDYYYWYYGSLALFSGVGPEGPAWLAWNKALTGALLPHQRSRKDGCAGGSWDADTPNGIGRWAFEGGRVYTTAMAILALEVTYRYLPVYWTPKRPIKAPPPRIPPDSERETAASALIEEAKAMERTDAKSATEKYWAILCEYPDTAAAATAETRLKSLIK